MSSDAPPTRAHPVDEAPKRSTVRARARVTLTVVVELPDVWPHDAPTHQVFHQAASSARTALDEALKRSGLSYHVYNSPRVEAVFAEADGHA